MINDVSSAMMNVTRDDPSEPLRTLRMTISYDGTNYCGWQIQPDSVSIQSVIEQALSLFTNEKIKVVASGRTDAGVHAVGQVLSFSTHSKAPCHAFLQGLACHLPDEIVVRAVEETHSGFHARYDAKFKWYRYVIHNSPIRIPFLRNNVLWQRTRLDQEAMNAAVQCLIGTHDFRCFETKWPNRSSSIRTIIHASVIRTSGWPTWENTGDKSSPAEQLGLISSASQSCGDQEPEFLCLNIGADGFLYNMVRTIVGTLIHVGRGRWTSADMKRILDTGDRTHAGETAPPQGLYLMRVDY